MRAWWSRVVRRSKEVLIEITYMILALLIVGVLILIIKFGEDMRRDNGR